MKETLRTDLIRTIKLNDEDMIKLLQSKGIIDENCKDDITFGVVDNHVFISDDNPIHVTITRQKIEEL